jgi:hypothetical protein
MKIRISRGNRYQHFYIGPAKGYRGFWFLCKLFIFVIRLDDRNGRNPHEQSY